MIDVTAVTIAVASLVGVVISTLQARGANRRASELERRRLDATTADGHWQRTDDLIERLSSEIERLDQTLQRTREMMERGEKENAALRARLAKAEVHIARLRSLVEGLAQEMESAGLRVPAGVSEVLDSSLG